MSIYDDGAKTTECKKDMTAFEEKAERIAKACNILNEQITRLSKVFHPVLRNFDVEESCEEKSLEPISQFDAFIDIIERYLYQTKDKINNIIEKSVI